MDKGVDSTHPSKIWQWARVLPAKNLVIGFPSQAANGQNLIISKPKCWTIILYLSQANRPQEIYHVADDFSKRPKIFNRLHGITCLTTVK